MGSHQTWQKYIFINGTSAASQAADSPQDTVDFFHIISETDFNLTRQLTILILAWITRIPTDPQPKIRNLADMPPITFLLPGKAPFFCHGTSKCSLQILLPLNLWCHWLGMGTSIADGLRRIQLCMWDRLKNTKKLWPDGLWHRHKRSEVKSPFLTHTHKCSLLFSFLVAWESAVGP